MEENKDDSSETVNQIIIAEQVNISNDNGIVNANQNNEFKNIEKESKDYIRNRNGNSGETDNSKMLLWGLVLIFAVGGYVKYRWQILLGFIVVSLLIELLTCMIYYKGKKNGILQNKNLRQIVIFNIISVLVITILIVIINDPISNDQIKFEHLKQQIKINNLIQTYFTNPLAQSAMVQMVGLFFRGIFLIYIFWSDLYIIAVLNIEMKKKGRKHWKQLLKWTRGTSKESSKHIKMGIFWMVISAIMTKVVPYIFPLIQQNS